MLFTCTSKSTKWSIIFTKYYLVYTIVETKEFVEYVYLLIKLLFIISNIWWDFTLIKIVYSIIFH